MRGIRRVVLFVVAVVAALLPLASVAGGQESGGGGFFTVTGSEAAVYRLPGDMELVKSFSLPAYGLTYERYQQVFGDHRAKVLGGQITLYRSTDGNVETVIGAHYSELEPVNRVSVSRGDAAARADRDVGPALERRVELLIDPSSNRFVYRVDSIQVDHRWFHVIDAGSGARIERFDALAHQCTNTADAPCGLGVAGHDGDVLDVKDLDGLTRQSGSSHLLYSPDGRQETHDQGSSRRPFLGPIATDSDNLWLTVGRTSPGQGALVDAHYYANVTDDYLSAVHGYNWVGEGVADPDHNISAMVTHAHYSVGYVNAFWNGSYVAIGDGDGVTYRELTPLDVVSHEFTHGVTDFTSNLIYQGESGALNEAFSDVVAAAVEEWAEDQGREPGTSLEPDWTVGEDLHIGGNGFRNMEDPEEDGDPDHYSERYTGTGDNGGVHINSAVPNHAFYLLAEGGPNASCRSTADHDSAHCTGEGLTSVPGIGLPAAEGIFFLGFTALTENATMCDARAATVAVAGDHDAAVAAAWSAVGVTSTQCAGGDGGGDDLPTVALDSPGEGAEVSGTVTVSATAGDDVGVTQVEFFVDGSSIGVDQNSPYSVSWDTTASSNGSHTVTATATDTASQTASDTNPVTVSNATAGGDTMHIGDLDGSAVRAGGPTWDATVTITVHDVSEMAVSGATVSGTWTDGTSSSCTTGSAGTCSFTARFNSKKGESQTLTIGSVAHSTLSYDAVDNHDPESDSNGTEIRLDYPAA